MTSDDKAMIVFEILFIIVGILGFLASIFNWEWYFGLTRKSRFLIDLIGEKNYRIFNAIVCVLIVAGAIYCLINW